MAFLRALPRNGEGCVTWPFAKSSTGVGVVWFRNRNQSAARVVCEMVNGPAPDKISQTAHSCGNGHLACVAPWHVSWKTPKGNADDRTAHGKTLRGQLNPNAKLTDEQAADIRVLAKSIIVRDIATHYGINVQTVRRIVKGERWVSCRA